MRTGTIDKYVQRDDPEIPEPSGNKRKHSYDNNKNIKPVNDNMDKYIMPLLIECKSSENIDDEKKQVISQTNANLVRELQAKYNNILLAKYKLS